MVRQFKQNFTEYTFEISLMTPGSNGVDQPLAATFNPEAQDAATNWASAVIKKTNGNHVSFYSFAPGLLKLKFTSKKTFDVVSSSLGQANAAFSGVKAPKPWPLSKDKSFLKVSLDKLADGLSKAVYGFSSHVRASKTVSIASIKLKAGHGAGKPATKSVVGPAQYVR